jgi:hypothetical protein
VGPRRLPSRMEPFPAGIRRVAVRAFLLAAPLAVRAATPPALFPQPLSPRNASYAIEVSLDPVRHALEGKETIRFRNATTDPVPDLAFHLYMNAFANAETEFMRESGGRHRQSRFDDSHWGNIVVSSLAAVEGGKEVPLEQEFPGPDRTVMRARLPAPVPPGGELEIRAAFTVTLPRVFARTGWAGRFHMVGQWFPKLGVWEQGRGWNCHPFHFASEFFSDFGVYDVAIDVPEDQIVGATGVIWAERKGPSGRKTVLCRAEDVHDFAWTASPRFVERTEKWNGVLLRVLMQPENSPSIPRYLEAAKRSLDFLTRKLGPYPYGVLTLVDPPAGGEGAGGMEYPTLVTGAASPLLPRRFRLPEIAVVHEVAHQYWYGLSANNEAEEAWLDEGIATYHEMRILESWFGKDRAVVDGLAGLSLGAETMHRLGYLRSADAAPVRTRSWEYPDFASYGAGLVLRTLENLSGTNSMDRLLRAFHERARFRHPTGDDFLLAVREEMGPGTEALARKLLEGTDTVDFSVLSARNEKREPLRGFDLSKTPPVLAPAPGRRSGDAGPGPDSEVAIGRSGGLVLPVAIRMTFSDGSVRDEAWDGAAPPKVYRYPGRELAKVEVDPEGLVPLEKRRLDNGWQAGKDPVPASRLVARWRWALQALYSGVLAAF